MTDETILTNAILVLPEATLHGTLVMRGGASSMCSRTAPRALAARDLDGDYLIPGIVDTHTDNLERQVQPRSLARWPSRSAMVAHDAQCAAAGVTTVFDALCLGDLGFDKERIRTFRDGVVDLDALNDADLLKAEHFLHLRCEVPALDMLALFDTVADHALVRMVSLMDHSPGVGQYADLDFYRALRRRGGMDDDYIERRILELQAQREQTRMPHRRALLDRVAGRDIALASHDDRTEEEIAENAADGIDISEFPVTMAAAKAAKAAGMQVIAGAPNIVRGGSHSGNVSAADLLETGAVDAFASDYVPNSLVEAAFQCAQRIGLPQAIALVTERPARMAGLDDRGRLGGRTARRPCARPPARRSARGATGLAGRRARRLMAPDARVAVYYAPLRDDVLFADAAAWLGRDPASGRRSPQPDIADIAEVTAEPRLLRLPRDAEAADAAGGRMRWDDVVAAAAALADRIAPFDLPPLSVQDVFGFLALRETEPSAPLAGAGRCLRRTPRSRSVPRRRRPNLRAGAAQILPHVRTRCWSAGAIPTCSTPGSST